MRTLVIAALLLLVACAEPTPQERAADHAEVLAEEVRRVCDSDHPDVAINVLPEGVLEREVMQQLQADCREAANAIRQADTERREEARGARQQEAAARRVTFTLEGRALRASVIHTTPTGDNQAIQRLPWEYTLDNVEPGTFLYLSAQNESENGTITCTITQGGRTVARSSTSVAYGIATCSGSAS